MPDMLRLAMVAVVASVSAMSSAEAVVRLADHGRLADYGRLADHQRPAALRAATVEVPDTRAATVVPGEGGAVMKAGDGHFWADGEVNGARVRFLVDTGATAVSLSMADAQRLGIDTSKLNYDYNVITADGRTRAASVKLASVAIAGAKVRDVDALVIEKGLENSLLGMSYLGRLSRFEATPNSLILHP